MAPHATPVTTIEDIDECIWWVLMTAPRNIDWRRIVDALLDQRNAITRGQPPTPPTPSATPQTQHGLPHAQGRR